jgi:hypothetical protein
MRQLRFVNNEGSAMRGAVLDPQSVTYGALGYLVPLGSASPTPTVLVVRSDGTYRTFAELIE